MSGAKSAKKPPARRRASRPRSGDEVRDTTNASCQARDSGGSCSRVNASHEASPVTTTTWVRVDVGASGSPSPDSGTEKWKCHPKTDCENGSTAGWWVRRWSVSQAAFSAVAVASVPWVCNNGSGAGHAAMTSRHRTNRDQRLEGTRCTLHPSWFAENRPQDVASRVFPWRTRCQVFDGTFGGVASHGAGKGRAGKRDCRPLSRR